MELPDVLAKACDDKVMAEISPLNQDVEFLQLALSSFVDYFNADARRRVVGAMLVAIGHDAPQPDPRLALAATDLRGALLTVLEWVGGLPVPIQEETASEIDPGGAPAQDEQAAQPNVVEIVQPASADPEAVETADRILAEIDATDFHTQHPLRLAPLLQALVAECRMVKERLPETHPKNWQLSEGVRRLGSLRKRLGVNAFVLGLAREHREDWPRVAREARAKLSRYDRDAETEVAPLARNGNGKKEVEIDTEPAESSEWPTLPELRKRVAEGRKVIVVGGWIVKEKIQLVKNKIGIDIDWYHTDPKKPLAVENAVSRVKGGKVAAVIVLENLLHHKDWKRIVAACELDGIPRACANRGGIGSLQAAFVEIERQITEVAA